MKKCSKCKEYKEEDSFHKSSKSKDGLKSSCKECAKAYSQKRYSLKKDFISQGNKRYAEANKDKRLELGRRYYNQNKQRCNDKSRRWQKKNKEYLRKYTRERAADRKASDPIYKLSCRIRSSVHKILKNKRESSSEYIGCDYKTLLLHLNSNSYGFYYGDGITDIDHITPLNSASNEDELIKLTHYTNLQLLPSYYNRHIKKEKEFNKKDFEKWLAKQ
jgi:hypothetical protein